jgi:hypothetical protein
VRNKFGRSGGRQSAQGGGSRKHQALPTN